MPTRIDTSRWTKGYGGKVYSYTQNVSTSYTTDEQFTRNNTSDFNEHVQNGDLLPINVYKRSRVTGASLHLLKYKVYTTYTNPIYNTTWEASIYLKNLSSVSDLRSAYASEIQDARNRCNVKLHDMLRDVQVQSLVEIGELKETRKMLHDALKDLERFIRVFRGRHGKQIAADAANLLRYATRDQIGSRVSGSLLRKLRRKGRLRSTIKRANNRYLEFQLGWNPLASSLEDIADQVVRQVNGLQKPRKFARAGATAHGNGSLSSTYYSGPYSSHPYTVKVRNTFDYSVHMGGLLTDTDVDLCDQWGLSASEILPTLWELTTLSFVVDYFTNFSDWLKNADLAYRLLNPNYFWISEKLRSVRTVVDFDIHPLAGSTTGMTILNKNISELVPAETFEFSRRQAYPPDTVIKFQFETPSLRQSLNVLSLGLARIL